MILWIWSAAALVALLLYLRQVYSRFSRYGVKHFRTIPVLGNMATVLLRLDHIAHNVEKSYFALQDERFFGRYEILNPIIVLRDLELVKKITVKDFEHFLDHRSLVDQTTDPLFGRNLFSLKGQEWKDMRSTLSPAFTSSKIRLMVPFMVEVGDQMIRSLKDKIEKSKGDSEVDYIDIDAKDLSTRYSNDVIASCAFGLKVDSHMDEDNQFYERGREASTFKFKQILLLFAFSSLPQKLVQVLKLKLFSKATTSFFTDLVLSTMQHREDCRIIRPDMIHLLMEAKKGNLTHDEKVTKDADAGFATVEESTVGKKDVNKVWTDSDLIAQALLFFIAGFETVSSAMSFVLHELAVNPDIQEKLVQEIKETDAKNGGKFDYNSIQQMTYMDMVVSETLRLWPPAVGLDRLCIKDYNMGKPNAEATQDYVIREGEAMHIPVWSFHRDPEMFPDPLRFDPERFSDENKHNIKPFAYMPFGLGPRNCIGSRFALCEVKVMVYQLLLNMELSPGPNTQIPAKLSPDTFNIKINGGHWLRMKARN